MANIIQINGYTISSSNSGGGSSFPYTGSAIISGSLVVTGSIISTLGFTGSLFGTSSWATNFVSASNYVLNNAPSSFVQNSQTSSFVTNSQTSSFVTNSQTSSFVTNSQTSSMSVATASYVSGSVFTSTNPALSASYALTASYAANATFNSISSVIGNGLSSSFNINHGFNTRNLHITIYESGSNGETVYPDIRRINANTASIIFANPPLTNQYIVYISQ